MLNMKKLIDETDFDNLNNLSKQWQNTQDKQQPENNKNKKRSTMNKNQSINNFNNQQIYEQKQNNSYSSNENIEAYKQDNVINYGQTNSGSNLVQKKKRNVVPQVIDEDTEHFRNKLDNLLNNFKVDAVSQFMAMKKDMMEYQKECVKNDTHKYLTMYEQKHQELLKTKEQLLSVSRQAQKKTIQVQLLSEHIAKLNTRLRSVQSLSIPFGVLYKNKQKQKMIKFKQNQARIFNEKRLKKKSIWGWKGSHNQIKNQRTTKQNQDRVQSQVNEIVGRFQKQMQLLKSRLEEATRKNQQYQNSKVMLQQNLKKAFLRGVTAMNMQAMGVLGDNVEEDDWASCKQAQQTIRTQKQRNHTKNSSLGDSHVQNHSMHIPKTKNHNFTNTSSRINADNQTIIISNPKSESKNHKWKQAPIMGVQQQIMNEEPRMQVVRPTTQGKVIKVIDGKSAVGAATSQKKPTLERRQKKF